MTPREQHWHIADYRPTELAVGWSSNPEARPARLEAFWLARGLAGVEGGSCRTRRADGDFLCDVLDATGDVVWHVDAVACVADDDDCGAAVDSHCQQRKPISGQAEAQG